MPINKEKLATAMGKSVLQIWEKFPDCSVEFRNDKKRERLTIIAHLPCTRGNWGSQKLINYCDINYCPNIIDLFEAETDLIIKHLEAK